jgi:hypothetical protein
MKAAPGSFDADLRRLMDAYAKCRTRPARDACFALVQQAFQESVQDFLVHLLVEGIVTAGPKAGEFISPDVVAEVHRAQAEKEPKQ